MIWATLEGLLKGRRRRRAIRDYVRRLPRLLRRDYGPGRHYTPAQIRASIARGGLDVPNSCYALAMFSDEATFDSYHAAIGEACDFGAMRAEVAETQFHGDVSFTAEQADAAAASAEPGWHGGHDTGGHGHGHAGHGDGGH